MSAGFVYILINNSMHGLVKIGRTQISSQERAKQLSNSTGVPAPFIVAYDLYAQDCVKLERELHEKLSDFRVSQNREFFRYPLNDVIKLLQDLSSNSTSQKNTTYEAVEILGNLKEKYNDWIISEISSVRVYQTYGKVYLEITKDDYIRSDLVDQYIKRTDLGFITAEYDDLFFDPALPVTTNADRFINEFDPYSIINCIDELFTKEAIKKIVNEFEKH
ncbi:GIY-YIG nuclease family protein [Brevibacillus sp. HB1.1]|uniref:GIY-YIG nuclease family protein n=1 Tax=Brevibacillus sp. HB1.1 TaxID=2738808 RepID=UPI001575ABE7|nr:GIY-YIG nuclease family protein [Brevibacillus sp. HB1.1]NTU28833.1 GIY-YIG nuclease family protein [Brevibacillus sp. HB1.1]